MKKEQYTAQNPKPPSFYKNISFSFFGLSSIKIDFECQLIHFQIPRLTPSRQLDFQITLSVIGSSLTTKLLSLTAEQEHAR